MKIQLKNISKTFGKVRANDDISLTVEAGTIHGILGENGAGKSTLVKILTGYIRRDQGEIFLSDRPVNIQTPIDAMKAGIGMLHQDPLDFPSLSVLDNFIIGKSGKFWLNRRQIIREFHQLAHQFNFDLDVHEQLGNLTVGERQQVEILRLLSLGVKTLILDEPTTGISPAQKTALFAAMKLLAAQGKSVIFVSHKLEDVEKLCDRLTVMRQGKIVGHRELPCPEDQLISLIFGRELAKPIKPKTAGNTIALQLNNITIKSDYWQIKIDELQVKAGEVIGLAGLAGSGQQLLLQLCAGLKRSPTGNLYINSQPMTQEPYENYLKAGVGYCPADRLKDGLIPGLSIQEHIALKNQPHQGLIPWAKIRQKTTEAIAQFSIRGQPQTPVEKLSGGNQQRTQLALLPIPLNLLLMEYPTRGLDMESVLWVWQQLIARCQTGTAILFTSADLDEIMQYSDRVIVFSNGQISPLIPVEKLTLDRLGKMISAKFSSMG
jgi:simple sugar transport system ATP-binding protein